MNYITNIIALIMLLIVCVVLYQYIKNSIRSIKYNLYNDNKIDMFAIFIMFMFGIVICNSFCILYLQVYVL